MITDNIKNINSYLSISKELAIGFKAISEINFTSLIPGTYQLSDGVYYMLSEYQTKDISLAKLEAHRKYIDIQFMVDGEEKNWI